MALNKIGKLWKNICNLWKEKSTSEKWAIGITIFGGIVFLIAIGWFVKSVQFEALAKLDPDLVAKAGDFVGGIVGSLWALAGVLLVYAALQSQRKDFKQNLDSLNIQIDENIKQKEILKKQGQAFEVQRFENSFYQLLDHYLKIVDATKVQSSNASLNRQGFSLINEKYDDLMSHFYAPDSRLGNGRKNNRRYIDVPPKDNSENEKWIKDGFTSFINVNQDLIQFIDMFNAIINFLGKQVDVPDKEFYFNVLMQTNSKKANCLVAIHLFVTAKDFNKTLSYIKVFGGVLKEQLSSIPQKKISEALTSFYSFPNY